jgi:hypothetical protein
MPKIVERLTRQLRGKGVKNAKSAAYAFLKKAGVLDKKGALTKKGKKRNAMTPGQRAKARSAKASGKSPKAYKYTKRTNRATLKRRKKK